MPILSNNRHERFCQGIAKGSSATEAYRGAGYSGTGNVSEAAASRLLRNVKVASRLAELQAKAAQKHEITVENLTRDLMEVHAEARKDGQYAAAVAAHVLIARMHGFMIERREVDITYHKPAPLPTKLLELSESEWKKQFEKPAHREAIAVPGRHGNGRTS